jgi:hypothetical protein
VLQPYLALVFVSVVPWLASNLRQHLDRACEAGPMEADAALQIRELVAVRQILLVAVLHLLVGHRNLAEDHPSFVSEVVRRNL